VSDLRLAEDYDLVSGIAAGREAALSALYDRYHRQCFAFALRILGGEQDAEEAVQETFVRVWRSARQYDSSRAGVASWILSITRNLCIDEIRRRRRRVPELPTMDGAFEVASNERTDLEAEREILGAQVRQALGGLTSDQRRAIELVYFHGLTSQEVGRILAAPAPTVRSRLRLGLLKLAGVLQERGLASVD
jgi:RNA polymerase sigma-70 factor (ECF subfamily)